MHPPVREFLEAHLPAEFTDVIEIGSRDINGGVLDLIEGASSYVGVDIEAGPGVDVVADAAVWQPSTPVDLVICLEVFEHTEAWRDIVNNVYDMLVDGGTFLATCASADRDPHSATGESAPKPGEHYLNVQPRELEVALLFAGFADIDVSLNGRTARCSAKRGIR